MSIDRKGFRAGVAMILVNDKNQVFWAKRIGQKTWQFPQGGILERESIEEAMFRELYEEIGLKSQDVKIITSNEKWLYYRLPNNMIRYNLHPTCIGQKQKWFLLRLVGDEGHIHFNVTNTPEFDDYRWTYYWSPIKNIINFKKRIYRQILEEFYFTLFNQNNSNKG